MNYIQRVFIGGYIFSVAGVAAVDLFVFPALGLFPWFPFAGVLWLAGFLAVILAIFYFALSVMGYTQGAGGGGGGSQRQRSKGARER